MSVAYFSLFAWTLVAVFAAAYRNEFMFLTSLIIASMWGVVIWLQWMK